VELLTGTWVPTWVMVLVVSVLTVCLLVGVPLARSAGRRRGMRLARPEAYATAREKTKDTAMFLAALIPSLLIFLAVMGVSFIGLTGFAKDVMQWDHWTNVLVPLSLDGISVSFGAWAFVAVKRGRHPGRAYKIVLAAATVSATLNFVHGRDKWSLWAGIYLAFLSMAGMAMFHELLDQFMAGYDDEIALKTRYPRFGQRWLYAPLSTFAARRAWIVFPPDEGTRATVRNALEHLEDIREAKRQYKLNGSQRVREEQQAKLVEVHAKAEVRRARAAGRRVEAAPYAGTHTNGMHANGTQANGTHANGTHPGVSRHVPMQAVPPQPQQAAYEPVPHPASHPDPQPAPAAPAPLVAPAQAAAPQVNAEFMEPDTQGQFERRTIFDPAMRAEIEPLLTSAPARDAMGRHPLNEAGGVSNRPGLIIAQDPVRQMISEAIDAGDEPTLQQVREWVEREFKTKPSYEWVRVQLKAARQRDTVGVDADLS
jgi:hypothetical protein